MKKTTKGDIDDLKPGDIIEWKGREGFIIPDVFTHSDDPLSAHPDDPTVLIAFSTSLLSNSWNRYLKDALYDALSRGQFKIKDSVAEIE